MSKIRKTFKPFSKVPFSKYQKKKMSYKPSLPPIKEHSTLDHDCNKVKSAKPLLSSSRNKSFRNLLGIANDNKNSFKKFQTPYLSSKRHDFDP